jgi:hypothetical protein
LLCLGEQRRNIDRHPEFGEANTNRFEACDPLCALSREEGCQVGVVWIQKVTEHVYVTPGFDGRDFNPGNDVDASRFGSCTNLGDGRNRVMVRHRDDPYSGVRGALHQLMRCTASIRRRRVDVEIDHWSIWVGDMLNTRRVTAPRHDAGRWTRVAARFCGCAPAA